MKINIISLGCPRNLVDSEVMMGALMAGGAAISDDFEDLDIAIVNTCAFVKDAKEESINTILQLADYKKKGKIRHIIVAGCLAQRYAGQLKDELKEVDAFIGTGDYHMIKELAGKVLADKHQNLVSAKPEYIYSHKEKRYFITPRHFAYLKIQEGCRNCCAYCVIPQIRGVFRSRPIGDIIKEACLLDAKIAELNIIGQDTTLYGADLYKKASLDKLLEKLSALDKFKWIRLLYTHPAHYTAALIDVIKDSPSICKYLDLPLQHINDKILKAMNRHTTKSDMISLIEVLRKKIPGLAIRTTFLVGFPGETDEQFKELLGFVKEAKFERMGVFIYSREEGTRAYDMPEQVPARVKKKRFDELMKAQQDISTEINRSYLGKDVDVLIDEVQDKDVAIGRGQFDAPEVDGQVFVRGRGIRQGEIVKVNITDTLEYDLVGVKAAN